MEFVLGFIVALLVEGCVDLVLNKKIKLKYRKIMLSVITLLYLGIICGLGLLAMKVDETKIKIFFAVLISFVIVFLSKLWLKVYKEKALGKDNL